MALGRIDVSEELVASLIRVKRISKLRMLAVTSYSTANVPSSLILFAWKVEAVHSSEMLVLTRATHGVTSKKMAFFIVIAVKTLNPTRLCLFVLPN
jgi:hypothetical protein